MSIYDNPKEYAGKIGCTLEQSEKICSHYLKFAQEEAEQRICPKCGGDGLFIDNDGADYSCEYWVECPNCGFTDDVEKYQALQFGHDFDPLLYFGVMPIEERNREISDWQGFIEREIADLEKKDV